jgi:hypothetical protein
MPAQKILEAVYSLLTKCFGFLRKMAVNALSQVLVNSLKGKRV